MSSHGCINARSVVRPHQHLRAMGGSDVRGPVGRWGCLKLLLDNVRRSEDNVGVVFFVPAGSVLLLVHVHARPNRLA